MALDITGWRALPGISTVLGEGLHWDTAGQCLWMTDIHGRRLWRVTGPGGGAPLHWELDQRIGWVIPCTDGQNLVLGLQQGFAVVPQPIGEGPLAPLRWLHRPFEGRPALRLNDAKADSTGALWAGSMNNDDESQPEGCLFRLSADGRLEQHDEGYGVANGPAIRGDERLMLHTDSARRTIYAFDLDVQAGRLRQKRTWLHFETAEGYPDGMCFDQDGCLWVAHWGGGCITRRDPEGRVMRRVDLPAPHITNVCFGGPDLSRLFVSSARAGLDAGALAEHPLSGSLFEVDAQGVRGLACRAFGDPGRGPSTSV